MTAADGRLTSRMKGYIRGSRRGVWHIPLKPGESGIIHTFCGWALNKPERHMAPYRPMGPVCDKCTARRG